MTKMLAEFIIPIFCGAVNRWRHLNEFCWASAGWQRKIIAKSVVDRPDYGAAVLISHLAQICNRSVMVVDDSTRVVVVALSWSSCIKGGLQSNSHMAVNSMKTSYK